MLNLCIQRILKTFKSVPYYDYETPQEISVPKNCAIVGVELCDEAVALPEFCHPIRCAYIFGPERGSLSKETQEKCDYMVKIQLNSVLMFQQQLQLQYMTVYNHYINGAVALNT